MAKILLIFVIVLGVLAGGYFAWSKGHIPSTGSTKNSQVAEIKKRGKLIIGTDATYPPMEGKDKNGKVVGFDIDLGNEIGKEMGVPVEFKEIAFDKLFESLNNGEIDLVISSVTITTDRSKIVSFSSPYINAGQSVIVAVNNNEVVSKDDLKDKKIAAQKDTTSLAEAQKLTGSKNLEVYISEYDNTVSKLIAGKIDAIIMDYPAAVNLVQNNPGTKIVGNPFTSEFYGVVTFLGKDGLLSSINGTISKLKSSGNLSKLEKIWFKQ